MYAEEITAPMKRELTNEGFLDLIAPNQVSEVLDRKEGTTLLVVNSVCGCAAGSARPGVKHAVRNSNKTPNLLTTVFAGVDKEATERAREYLLPYPPSSPCIALFKDGNLVHFIERHHIEGNSAEAIGQHLSSIFEEYCS